MTSFDQPKASRGNGLGIRDYVLLALVLLAIGGIAVMDFNESWGFWYWVSMVPVFGGLSVFMEWHAQSMNTEPRPVHVRAQVLHWMVTLLGVLLVFLVDEMGPEGFDRTMTGLMSLLVLGLSTVLIGIHTEWRLAVVGALLLATLAAAVAAEQFFWVMLVPTVVALWLMRRKRR